MTESKVITVEEIAQRIHAGKLTVYRLLERGEIPSTRVGTRYIISRNAYERWEENIGSRPQLTGAIRKIS